jgi:hypothetical protein
MELGINSTHTTPQGDNTVYDLERPLGVVGQQVDDYLTEFLVEL